MFVAIFIVSILLLFLNQPVNSDQKTINLRVLVDNEGRITYTGSKEQCQSNLTKELKLIKLEGILQ
jgi:hypothetical protein